MASGGSYCDGDRPLWLGLAVGSSVQRETISLLYSHSKTNKLNVNVQLPTSKGTIIKELTLQIKNNLQHDISPFTAKSKRP